MKVPRDRLIPILLACLTLGPWTHSRAAPRETGAQGQLSVVGEIVDVHAPRLFTIRERGTTERMLVVLAPPTRPPISAGTVVIVDGIVREISGVELQRAAGWAELTAWMRKGFAGNPMLVATRIAREGDRPDSEAARISSAVFREPAQPATVTSRRDRVTVRAGSLAMLIDELAGWPVRILNARVVGVLEPHAFLIEPATTYTKTMGFRDRLLVLLQSGTLRVSDQALVGSTVVVFGTARSLLGVQTSADAPWPAELRPQNVERWEVRGAVVATSVQTADGTELTQGTAGR